MATIKLKFRFSTIATKEGSLYFQIIHKRVARQINTGYKLFPTEWEGWSSLSKEPMTGASFSPRAIYLQTIKQRIERNKRRLKNIIFSLEEKEKPYSSDDIVLAYLAKEPVQKSFSSFMHQVIEQEYKSGNLRLAEIYKTTLRSFMRFRENNDIDTESIDNELIRAYEVFLKARALSPNTTSFYMRNLRAVYNQAVEAKLTSQKYPFKKVYTGVEKTQKRAIGLALIRQIKRMDFSASPQLDYARDLFLFSFYTRGMSFVDMAFLKKSDLNQNILSYRRKKTGDKIFIAWEKSMQLIVDKYDTSQTPYLLPVIRFPNKKERRQYLSASQQQTRKLKIIGEQLGLSMPLTMYVSRHSWASAARDKNIPISIISEALGHHSQATTEIYLSSLKKEEVDIANKKILNDL